MATMKDIQDRLNVLNKNLGVPNTPYTLTKGRYVPNVGTYVVVKQSGGWLLEEMLEHGVSRRWNYTMSKKEILEKINTLILRNPAPPAEPPEELPRISLRVAGYEWDCPICGQRANWVAAQTESVKCAKCGRTFPVE